MRVYAESNFVLELVLEQEQHEACQELVELAQQGKIELCLPALALFEPFTTLNRRQRDRNELHDRLQRELSQLRRTKAFSTEVTDATLPALLLRSSQQAAQQYAAIQEQLLIVARILPLTSTVLAAAQSATRDHGLELPDAIVLASVLEDLSSSPRESCFLNRNTKDFNDPSVVGELEQHSCKMLGSFVAGTNLAHASLIGTH